MEQGTDDDSEEETTTRSAKPKKAREPLYPGLLRIIV